MPLGRASNHALKQFPDVVWNETQTANATSLFEEPIAHFIVRAFATDGMNETWPT